MRSVRLEERPVQIIGRPTKFVQYKSQRAAFEFLREILTGSGGVGLLHGPESSGRLALLEQFVRELETSAAVAAVDGARLKTHQLLTEILSRFGYDVELGSTEELLNMLHVFVVQQTRSRQAPVLILENINDMYPSALCVLCKLAALTVDNQFALRIVLVSDRFFRRIMNSPSMRPIASRMIGDMEIQPLTANESLGYLYSRLQSHGVESPSSAFSIDVCADLHAACGGWPTRLDSIATAVLEQARHFPICLQDIDLPAFRSTESCDADLDAVDDDTVTSDGSPKLVVTRHGEIVQEMRLTGSRVFIGRSDLCDILVDDEYVSKHHAAAIRGERAVILVDLNSRNGTFVNSHRVKRHVLRDSDIVSIGEHRIKVLLPAGYSYVAQADIADTTTMRNMVEDGPEEAGHILPVLTIDNYTS
jgi:type II secretory pathway predicted ATPase ExeA